MSITTLEFFRALLVAALLVYVLISGKTLSVIPGWRYIVTGLGLIFLSTLVSFIGYPLKSSSTEIRLSAEYLVFFERIMGYCGFLLLVVGTLRGLETIPVLEERKESAETAFRKMKVLFEKHTKRLTVLNQQVQSELAKRQNAERKTLEEKKRLQLVLHSIGEAVITTDAIGVVQYLNPTAESLTGWTADSAQGLPLGKVFHVIDERTRERLPDLVDQCLRKGEVIGLPDHAMLLSRTGSEYAVQDSVAPIRDWNNEILGVVLVFNDVTEARRMAWQMTYHATHDDLTGLFNRREFERRLRRLLEQARLENTNHALCYLDLDQFKVINDTCGHMAGDELLRQIGRLLQARTRKMDTLARLGGDEFGVLMESCVLDQAKRVANGLREAVESFRFEWQGKRFNVGVSIGLVPISDNSESITGVLRSADSACYTAKEKGRNRIHVVYKEDDTELVKRRGEMQWMFLIPWALDENRFELNFQTIFPLNSHAQQGHHYELLLRMRDPKGSLVQPGAFLLAAERYNLATKLDEWVIEAAFNWLLDHPEHLKDLHLCEINLSGHSVGNEQFLEFITARLKKGNIPPAKICFEITETAAIANLANATRFIKALKSLGCRFALDDFGSGLSSFAYLKNLPVDLLKIDGIFVKDIVEDPIDSALVKSINEVGKVMGLQTVAEFVENEAILNRVRELGVDYAQGYAINRPKPLTELKQHL
ncbi:MAG: EAL domain-containing protein [Candidatus Competibacteraceae bacterium]|jgi:diguanylate cyclase (GGDEF)-like protein/PAS domain S-box-containing protein|nr:EAL domain-containing protein [Candidatus Competibacteraceae bacterium]